MKTCLATFILLFCGVNLNTTLASSDEAWAELFANSKATCIKLSNLTSAKSLTKYPNQFEDSVLVLVRGIRNAQSSNNGKIGETATFACLYDKITLKAEISDLSDSAYQEQFDTGQKMLNPSQLDPLSFLSSKLKHRIRQPLPLDLKK